MNEWLAAAVEKVATQPTSADQLIAIAILAISPTLIGPLPIFVDLLRRNGAPSWIPWFVMGFWTLAAVVPMLLSAAGLIDREKMMYGGYGFWAQIVLAPAFLLPLFFLSAYLFTLLFGVRQQRIFAFAWMGVGLLLLWPWLAFAFHGI
ncbi:MAG: hypothetical protein ABL957_08045 [Parvularculaceae bacterium]